MLAEDIAKLMAMIPLDEEVRRQNDSDKIKVCLWLHGTKLKLSSFHLLQGGAFDQVMETKTPFMFKGGEGINAGVGEVEWVIAKDRYKYDAMFDTLNPIDGKVSGASAKSELETRDRDSDNNKQQRIRSPHH